MKARLTPRQKKLLSYAKDRRNVYGERGAQSRFAISDSKALVRRSKRRVVNNVLKAAQGETSEDRVSAVENRALGNAVLKRKFHKVPDSPLGEVVQSKHARRARMGMTKNKKVR